MAYCVQNNGCNSAQIMLVCHSLNHSITFLYRGGEMSEIPDISAVDPWDAFVIDDDAVDPEPEPGDFWGELDDDCDYRD